MLTAATSPRFCRLRGIDQSLDLRDEPALEGSRTLGTGTICTAVMGAACFQPLSQFNGTIEIERKPAQALNQPQTLALCLIRGWRAFPGRNAITEQGFIT